MKTIVSLKSKEFLHEVKHLVDGFVVTNHFVSARFEHSFTVEDIFEIATEVQKQKKILFLLVDVLCHESMMNDLVSFIDQVQSFNLYYIFSDLGVYEILKERNLLKKAIYAPDTLLTNYLDFNLMKSLKLFGAFPAVEIPVSDIEIIGKNRAVKLFYRGFGQVVMFQSRRKLLTRFQEHTGLSFDANRNDLTLVEELRQDAYRIMENEHGTHMYQPGHRNVLPVLDVLMNAVDFLFLDGTFIPKEKFLKTIEIYGDALVDIDRLNFHNGRLKRVFPNLNYNFIYEDTVYRKEDLVIDEK